MSDDDDIVMMTRNFCMRKCNKRICRFLRLMVSSLH